MKSMNAQGNCLVCSTPNGAYFVPINEFKIYKCSNCGLEHTYPIPSTAQLKAFYSTYSDIRAATDVVRINAKNNLELLATYGYTKQKLLLDFGTGNGEFVDIGGENCFGVDFKHTNTPRIYPHLSLLPSQKYDVITLWGVLEHLANPIDTLMDLRKFIKPDGLIVLTTVNAEGVIPYYFKPVEHLTYWTKLSFEYLFNKTGIKLIEYKPYAMKQRSDIYVQRLISRTPMEHQPAFNKAIGALPKYINVPTNEILVVGKYMT